MRCIAAVVLLPYFEHAIVLTYRIRLTFGGDFNLALWRCGSRTANNNVRQ